MKRDRLGVGGCGLQRSEKTRKISNKPFLDVEVLRHVGHQADSRRRAMVRGAIPLGGGNQVREAELGRPADAARLAGVDVWVHAEAEGGLRLGILHGSERGRKHGRHGASIGEEVGTMNDVNTDDARCTVRVDERCFAKLQEEVEERGFTTCMP